jgi:hypothetical protein
LQSLAIEQRKCATLQTKLDLLTKKYTDDEQSVKTKDDTIEKLQTRLKTCEVQLKQFKNKTALETTVHVSTNIVCRFTTYILTE